MEVENIERVFSSSISSNSSRFRATAQDVYATLHVVCEEDLSLSTCTNLFGRKLEKIFQTHCIRHFTIQYEYIKPGEDVNRCAHGPRRRRHRGHQSHSEGDVSLNHSQIDLRLQPLSPNYINENSYGESV